MEQLFTILEEIKPGIDFHTEANLFGDHILASMDILMLVAALNDAYDIEIALPDIKPENFKSAETIYAMVERHLEED